MPRQKSLVRRIAEALEPAAEEQAPTVDELVAFPEADFDDPSELLGVAYDAPDEEDETGEGEIIEVSKKELDTQAKLVHGGLSRTSKMPCKSFPLPPGATCPAGSKLVRTDPYSVCQACYAKAGRGGMPHIVVGKKNRLQLLRKAMRSKTGRDRWVGEMVGSIERQGPYFRWHDSGDIFRPEYLDMMVEIMRGTPGTRHWIPTKQEVFVKGWVAQHGADELPSNANIRISAVRMNEEKNQPTPFTASSVFVAAPPEGSFGCPATWDQGFITRHGRRTKTKAGPGLEPRCGPCRACWDRGVSQVCYRYHGALNKLPPELQPEMRARSDVMGPILRRLRGKG